MRWIKRLGILLGLVYLVVCTVLYFQQERMIFLPRELPADYSYQSGTEVELSTTDGIVLNALHYRKPEARGVILYLHGNRGNNLRSIHQTKKIRTGTYDTFLLDYRGYGKSEGRIVSEQQLYADAQLAYDHLKNLYGEENIIVIGYSLGTGMASYLASKNKPRHCVLVAPYVSITAMKNLFLWAVPDFILKYPLDNLEHLPRTNCPVTIIHGETDDFIPYTMAQQLAAAAPGRVTLLGLPNTSHRGAILHPKFSTTVLDLIP